MNNTAENIEVRREKVKLMLSLGYPHRVIASKLGYSYRTIAYDIKKIREEWSMQIKNIDLDQLIAEIRFDLNNRRRELMDIIRTTQDEKIKVSATRALAEENERIIRILQNAGAMDKIADKLDVSGMLNVQTAIPRKEPEDVEKAEDTE